MRLVFVVEEDRTFHPEYLRYIVTHSGHETVGVVIVSEVPDSYNTDSYFRKNRRLLTIREKMKLALRHASLEAQAKQTAAENSDPKRFFSVNAVVEHLGLDRLHVRGTVNTASTLEWIDAREPDVLISCGQAIFGQKLLAVPRKCAINRHSSLLPAYGGVLPIFHAYRRGESEVGSSIHTMEQKLDGGVVLAQARVQLPPREPMLTTYEKCFEASRKIILQALEKIDRGDFSPVDGLPAESYFSFPTPEEWKEFRTRGGRLI